MRTLTTCGVVILLLTVGCQEKPDQFHEAIDCASRCWTEARNMAWDLMVTKQRAGDNRPYQVVFAEVEQARLVAYDSCTARACK